MQKMMRLVEIKFVEWFVDVNIIVESGNGNSWPEYLLITKYNTHYTPESYTPYTIDMMRAHI